jgi:hypothetical protein
MPEASCGTVYGDARQGDQADQVGNAPAVPAEDTFWGRIEGLYNE